MQFIQGFVMVQKIDMYKLHIYNWPMFFELYFHVLCLNECYASFSFIKIKKFHRECDMYRHSRSYNPTSAFNELTFTWW